VTVLAPTWLEVRAVRRRLPAQKVSWIGVKSRRGLPKAEAGPVVLCGLCGGLGETAPGSVIVPQGAATPGGPFWDCDGNLAARLTAAANRLGCQVLGGRMLTFPRLLTGSDRAAWASRGFVAVDMEAARVLEHRPAAVVRVVLDSACQDICAAWEKPASALLRPSIWRELPWLLRAAPAAADLAARVAAEALT
jgi:hypothetical protein